MIAEWFALAQEVLVFVAVLKWIYAILLWHTLKDKMETKDFQRYSSDNIIITFNLIPLRFFIIIHLYSIICTIVQSIFFIWLQYCRPSWYIYIFTRTRVHSIHLTTDSSFFSIWHSLHSGKSRFVLESATLLPLLFDKTMQQFFPKYGHGGHSCKYNKMYNCFKQVQ